MLSIKQSFTCLIGLCTSNWLVDKIFNLVEWNWSSKFDRTDEDKKETLLQSWFNYPTSPVFVLQLLKWFSIQAMVYIDGSSSVNRINDSLVNPSKQAGVKWRFICVVFRPANGCSASRSLVKIICFAKNKFFCIFSGTKFFVFEHFMMEIDGKSCFSVKKNYFDQQMGCGAPICWSKYTTHKKVDPAKIYLQTYGLWSSHGGWVV